ncbi:D-alanyl-D-alanine carboxypeptidase [Lachnospiraceae bacterium PM6-15]|uniref:M15 family metallopeptidase n=1 Tax=Ohessyouella blattaphilus TaxID=2949333 RepID=A0ABT1EEV1_9FIRM|nr:M15 family metallopeptidase [Ohessyouella blattaphilus]MCP1109235.1 M15 family metallopeptidase [Ohessyouella blattaphilus]MCR8562629.1 M15 family metallopeptidase [Ohessyouella blattaphilus]
MRRRNRRLRQKRLRIAMIILLTVLVIVATFMFISKLVVTKTKATAKNITTESTSKENDWKLILVNRDNYIPEDHTVELIRLSNGESVDARIYPELQEMFDAARSEGLNLLVVAGYRTEDEQQQLLVQKNEEYIHQGYSRTEAKELAEKWVAIPGTSEHQLGIAVDINADTTISSSDTVYSWLANNGHKYGFIKRYPENKTAITGVINEPWHYRYVGKEAASEIYSKGFCLEEYLGKK